MSLFGGIKMKITIESKGTTVIKTISDGSTWRTILEETLDALRAHGFVMDYDVLDDV